MQPAERVSPVVELRWKVPDCNSQAPAGLAQGYLATDPGQVTAPWSRQGHRESAQIVADEADALEAARAAEGDQPDQNAATNSNAQQDASQLPDMQDMSICRFKGSKGVTHLVTRYRSPYFSTILPTHLGNLSTLATSLAGWSGINKSL